MALVANSLFEITAPDGTTVGFAACEEEADRQINEHMIKAMRAEFETQLVLHDRVNLRAWFQCRIMNYKIMRVG